MKPLSLFYPSLLLLFSVGAGRVAANPVGGQVQAGNASFNSSVPGTLNINQTSDKVIINWSSFSIAAGEVTRFIQPSANSAALNRVMSANPSEIYGSLQGNGHIYLINPNGILVGPGGQVNTKTFVASTLDVDNQSFLAGADLTLSGNSTAGIKNQGSIGALGGDVFLIAHTVENSGSISAPQGTVGLAAGSTVQLYQKGQERLSVLAGNAGASPADKGVNNLGTIEATTAELKAAGGNIYALAINNGGVVRATSLVNENGNIYLRSSGGNINNSGTLSAHNANGNGGSVVMDGGHNDTAASTVINSGVIDAGGIAAGAKGGEVKILGDHVGLFDQASVDVSGDAGGGKALIGGDYHGNNPGVQNAQETIVSSGASIKADALTTGQGGRVIVWSDKYTQFYGNISARGGSLGGNGGFTEVSGKDALNFQGLVDLRSPLGVVGNLLLDPKNITVATAGPDPIAGNSTFAQNPASSVTFAPANLVTALQTANVTLQANNNITFNNNVNASATPGTIFNLTLQAGNSITLNNATINLTHSGASAFADGAFNATFNDGGAVAADRNAGAATFTMTGTSSIKAAGGITIQAGNLAADVTGPTSLAANIGNITLTSLSTTPSSVSGSTADITVLNNLTPGKNITASGAISASGATAGGGNTAGDSAGNVQINASGAVSVSGVTADGGDGHGSGNGGNAGTVSLVAGAALTLNGGVSAAGGAAGGGGASVGGTDGTITLDNTGALTGSGLVAAGTLNLNGSGNVGVSGSSLNTQVGTLVLNKSGGDSFISEADALALQGTSGGNLAVAAGGNITDSGALTVNGAGKVATFNAGTHNITFNNAGDDFTSLNFNGVDVVITDANGINIGPSTATGNLTVNAGGSINSSGVLNVSTAGKTAAFNTTGVDADILLGSANNFTAVTVGASGGGNVRDLTLRNVSATAAVPSLPTTLRNLTLQFDNTGINLPATTLTGNLSVTAGGNITEGGALVVNGAGSTAAFNAGANNITLNNAGNDFTTASVNGKDVSLTDVNGIDLGASAVTGNLTVNAGGNITQSGALVVNGVAKTATFNAGANNITLNNAGNDFTTASVNGNDVSVTDANGIDLGASTVTGNLTVSANGNITDSGNLVVNGVGKTASFTAGAHDITLNSAGNDFTTAAFNGNNVSVVDLNGIDLGASTVAGNLSVTAGGDITQSGALIVNGAGKTASFVAGANNITLNNAGNDFTTAGFVANDVSVADVNAIDLAASTLTGNLAVTAGGSITESGPLLVAGAGKTASFTTTGVNADILLGAANNFSSVSVGALGSGTVRDLTLRNISAAAVLPGLPATLRNLTLQFDNSAINLPATTLTGDLSVTAGGDITESGPVVVNGVGRTATFNAGANNITLNDAGNDFTTAAFSGNDVSVTDANGLNLGASTLTGNLTVNAGGSITESGALIVAGVGKTASFTTTGVNADILLGQANNFNSVTVGAGGGGNVRDLTLRNVSPAASLPGLPATLRNLTLQFDNSAINLPGTAISGDLSVTAGGAITQSGALLVNGAGKTATFNAGANDITLNNAGNDFTTVALNGNNASVSDVNGVDLGTSTLTGNLAVNANGNITQSGAIIANGVGKTASFNAGANNITLNNAGNDFTTVGLVGNSASIADANGIDLAGTTLASLNVNANGPITQSGALSVGNASFNSGAGDITLNNAANDFGTASLHGNNASVTDANGIDLGASTLTGNLAVNANGAITQSGAIIANGVGKVASFNAGANNITLNNAGNDFTTVGLVGNSASIADANGIDLAGTTLASLSVNANGPITQSGALSVGNASFNSGAGDITLNNAANDFGTASLHGNNASVTDANGIDLGASTLTGNLAVNANGAITQSGAITANGAGKTATFNAGANDITLNNAGNDFTTVALNGNNASVSDVNGVDLGTSTLTGNLAVNANGNITQSGAIIANGVGKVASFNAGANNITLNNAGNDFTTVGLVGNSASIADANGIDLAGTTLASLSVNANGPITQSGALNVGNASFNSGAGDITLNNAANDFGTASLHGNNASVTDANGIDIGASTLTGNLAVNANGAITQSGAIIANGVGKVASFNAGANNITLNNAGNDFTTVGLVGNSASIADANGIDLAGTTLASLSVNANGPITQSGALSVGNASFNSGAGDITLNNAANDFGTASLHGNNASVTDANGIDLGASTLTGNLAVNANGAITQSGAITANGAGKTATFNAGANDITLNNAGNDFTTVALNGNNATVTDANGVDLGASTLTGNLAVNANGAITQSGAIIANGVGKVASFNAGANNITLNNAGNDFTTVGLVGNSASIADANGIDLAGTTLASLSVNANGPITQSGALNVGNASFNSGAGDITLNNAANDFGTASLHGNNASVTDANGIDIGASTLTGNLAVNANGAITQSGAIIANGVGKVASFNAGANNITLNNAGNDFTTVGLVGNSASIADANGIDLAGTTLASLNVNANGPITQSGALSVGNASFNSGAGDITLNNAANDFGTASLHGNNASVTDANGIDIGASTLTGNLGVTTLNGGVTQSGAIQAGGLRVTAAGPVTLNGANHVGNLSALVSGAGNAFSFSDSSALTVNTVDGVNGISTANGAITLSMDSLNIDQAVNSGGARTILQSLTPGRSIDLGTKTGGKLGLTDTELDLVTASVLQIGNAQAGSITISAPVSPAHAPVLALVDNSTVTETGSGTITDNGLLISSPGAVTLGSANHVNTLAAAITGSGNDFTFNNAGGLTVGTVDGVAGVSTVNGAISLATANGALTVGAGETVNAGASTVNLTAGSSGNDNPLTLGAASVVRGLGGVTLVADNMFIDASGLPALVDAGGSRVILHPFENGTSINLGGVDGPGMLGLSGAELSRIRAHIYQVGDDNTGNINLTGSVTLGNIATETTTAGTRLNLVTKGNVNQTGGTLTVPNLSIVANNGTISLGEINDANFLASSSSLSKTPILYVDLNNLNISEDPTWEVQGISPPSTTVKLQAGAATLSAAATKIAGIAYVEAPVLKLSANNVTASVEGDPKGIAPNGSISVLGLFVPFPVEQEYLAARNIEESTKWVNGRIVVSGSTKGPQTPQ